MIVAAMGIFSSCTKDAAEAPTINVSVVGNPDYKQGSEITYVVNAQTASDKDELSQLTITGDNLNPNYSMNYPASTTTSTDTLIMKIPASTPAGTAVKLTFEVSTNKDTSAVTTQSFTVTAASMEYTGVDLLYTSLNTTDKNFFSATDGKAYNAGGTASLLDVAFCWQSQLGYSLVSPDAAWLKTLWSYNNVSYSTSGKNTTKIMKFTGDYATADLSALSISSATVTGGGNGVQGLNNGDVIAFETALGAKGLMKMHIGAKKNSMVSVKVTVDVRLLPASTSK